MNILIIKLVLLRFKKLLLIINNIYLLKVFLKHRVLAGVEHKQILNKNLNTLVDIGANRGQFSLAAVAISDAYVYAFEPLKIPAKTYSKIFETNAKVKLFQVAIGNLNAEIDMHVSSKDDSSSLLKIGSLQHEYFPGTYEVGLERVTVTTLDHFVSESDIISPSLLKLDVQGFELQALKGCKALIQKFDHIYCECSFITLYEGQSLASEVITYLTSRNYNLDGVFNLQTDSEGNCIQADLLFSNNK
jgi:FkbM family methyltransferase